MIDPAQLRGALLQSDHPLGVKELLRALGLHPGQQTALKRALRDLLKTGAVQKLGKRYFIEHARSAPSRGEDERAGRGKEYGARGADDRGRGEDERAARGKGYGARGADDRGRGADERARRGKEYGARGADDRGRGKDERAGRGKEYGADDRGRGHDERGAPQSGEQRGGRPKLPEHRRPGRPVRFDQPPPRRPVGARRGPRGEVVEGILHVHRDGFGFVHPLEEGRENIFLPHAEAARALDHDRVKVEVLEGDRGRTFGRLLEVVDRVREQVVGTFFERGRKSFVVPHDQSLSGPIAVPPTQIARDGDLVKVRLGVGRDLLEERGALFGEISGSLGRPGEPSGEVLGIAFSQGFSDDFPSGAMDEADAIRLEVRREDWAGRRDLRDLKLVTIDGEDARDFDDAVYAEDREGGGWRLVVAIADVSHYVTDRSDLDREALRRATSVYLPNRVLPMLPERLSNGICSLKPSEDRLCMVADMQLDARGHLRHFELYPAVMRSSARCTYNEVQAVLDGQDVPNRNAFKPDFQRLLALSKTLTKMRSERGAIDFDLPETRIVLDDAGKPVRIERRDRKDAHRLVEECMLAANEAVAKFFQELELPSIYRFHGEPDPEKLAAFAELAGAHGFHLGRGGKLTSRELNKFVQQLQGHQEQRALNQLLLRSMMQAVYSAEEIGHYGLAASHYLHFTSPIRRYPDLMVHRLLKAHWARGALQPVHLREEETHRLGEVALQSSERERAAMQVEREVFAYYATLLMKDRVGEEFAAVVSGVTDFGFFVELEKELAEGLVKVESLGAGVRFDERRHALVLHSGRSVTVGQRLTVRLLSANIVRRQLELEVVVFEGEEPVAASSPHPGFDRLRRTAAEKRRPQGKKRGRR